MDVLWRSIAEEYGNYASKPIPLVSNPLVLTGLFLLLTDSSVLLIVPSLGR